MSSYIKTMLEKLNVIALRTAATAKLRPICLPIESRLCLSVPTVAFLRCLVQLKKVHFKPPFHLAASPIIAKKYVFVHMIIQWHVHMICTIKLVNKLVH